MAKSNFYNTAQTAAVLSGKMDKLPTELGTEHLDNVLDSDIYAQSQNAQVSSSLGYPDKFAGFLHVMTTPTGLMTRQIYYPYVVNPSTAINIWTRSRYSGTWTPWEKFVRMVDINAAVDQLRNTSISYATLPENTDFNTLRSPSMWAIYYVNHPNKPTSGTGTLEVLPGPGQPTQRFTSWGPTPKVYHRYANSTTWGAWV